MTTTTRTADGERLEISKAGFGAIRIESLDRNGTPNWGLTLTAADATEIADILGAFAADLNETARRNAAAKADDAAVDAIIRAKAGEAHRDAEGQRHTGAENAAAADPFAGLDIPTNDGWDA